MCDTVILATTREGCIKKLGLLQEFCAESGMRVNQSKTTFVVFNGTKDHKLPLICNGMTVDVCKSYRLRISVRYSLLVVKLRLRIFAKASCGE